MPKKDKDTYTCAWCHKSYKKGWTDEEAVAELKENFGDYIPEECDLICDSCYKTFVK